MYRIFAKLSEILKNTSSLTTDLDDFYKHQVEYEDISGLAPSSWLQKQHWINFIFYNEVMGASLRPPFPYIWSSKLYRFKKSTHIYVTGYIDKQAILTISILPVTLDNIDIVNIGCPFRQPFHHCLIPFRQCWHCQLCLFVNISSNIYTTYYTVQTLFVKSTRLSPMEL